MLNNNKYNGEIIKSETNAQSNGIICKNFDFISPFMISSLLCVTDCLLCCEDCFSHMDYSLLQYIDYVVVVVVMYENYRIFVAFTLTTTTTRTWFTHPPFIAIARCAIHHFYFFFFFVKAIADDR